MEKKINRKEERELLATLLFETEFRHDESIQDIFQTSLVNREIPDTDYIRNGYFGVYSNLDTIDSYISDNSNGWKTDRISKLSLSILRLAVFEMIFIEGIPYLVSINEAVELAKKFDDERARPFINGILNSVMRRLEADGKTKK